jgi:outer membrane murein-binding lipoprotein Lpp
MNTIGDRIRTLEMRIERLETWAGPGQVEALSANIRAIRTDMVAFRAVQKKQGTQLDELTTDVTGLKADVAELKADVSLLKADVGVLKDDVGVLKADLGALSVGVQEILRRLPAPPAA